MSKNFAVFALMTAIAVILYCFGSILPVHGQPDPKMRVMVYNDTEKKTLPAKGELWIRGIGSWWLQDATKFGGDIKEVPIEKMNVVDHLYIYPDGRGSGKEIKVPYKLMNDMCMNACVRDALVISISDSEITVSGRPFKAATGDFEWKTGR